MIVDLIVSKFFLVRFSVADESIEKDYKIDVTDAHEIRNVDVILTDEFIVAGLFAEVIQYAGKRAAGDLGVLAGLTFFCSACNGRCQLKVFLSSIAGNSAKTDR